MIDVVPGRLQDVAARLTKIDQVSYVAGTVGDGDLNVQIHAHDAEEVGHLVETAIGTIQGVTRVRTPVIPWKLKEICDWRMPAEFAGGKGAPMT
jgi:DNA-binding Lrp family transcriptional regulator